MFKFSELFKHSKNYPEKIQEIHAAVDMSSEKALAEARRILFDIESKNLSKAERLSNLGFKSIESVKELHELRIKKLQFEVIKKSIEDYSKKFPFNKFITKEECNAVCEKYNLYVGAVSWFKGFVPDRNIAEMERFVSNYDTAKYWKCEASKAYSHVQIITQEEYQNQLPGFSYGKDTPEFKIMAPDNQFYYAPGMRKVGREIIDDPIVLHEVPNGYIVVTAWGDEASDPIIVNEGNN